MFALGAFLLSASMGALSYFVTRHYLVAERENGSLHQAFLNASFVRSGLRTGNLVESILSTADYGTAGSHSVLDLRAGGKTTWYERQSAFGPDAIPAGLRDIVLAGTVATQTYDHAGTPEIAVGVPLRTLAVNGTAGTDHGAYFEIFDEADLSHTLGILAAALIAAGAVTTILGAALGRWASGRSLRPLTGISRAAVAIAGGQLETRLPATTGDPMAALTSSFNRMVDQLQERIEREARFTSDVSHELRSPLTTLSASLAVLEAQADQLSPSGRRALELLGADVRRFQRMVGDLLEISRSDTGSADVSLEEVDPGELVRHAVAAAQRSLGPKGPLPAVDVDPDVADIRMSVDKRRFERVMSNLLENAALYGGGATAVRVRAGPPVDGHPVSVRVSVEDSGPGVPAPERTRVFERFYRGHAAYRRSAGTGTGLGLALVAEHVRLHGGKVWADESEGGGARFTVELPARPADEVEEPVGGGRPG
jgi:two-component system, OmpR family, sensor histidine kinase MtrB